MELIILGVCSPRGCQPRRMGLRLVPFAAVGTDDSRWVSHGHLATSLGVPLRTAVCHAIKGPLRDVEAFFPFMGAGGAEKFRVTRTNSTAAAAALW